jgi:hypothetical protein
MMAIAIVGVKSILEEIGPLKVTKGKTAENRAAPMQADGRLFRDRGIDGVGVTETYRAKLKPSIGSRT